MRSLIVAAFSFALLSKGVVASPVQIREQDASCPTLPLPIGPGVAAPLVSALSLVLAELGKITGNASPGLPILPVPSAGVNARRDEISSSTTSSDTTLTTSSPGLLPQITAPAPAAKAASAAPTSKAPAPPKAPGAPSPPAKAPATPSKPAAPTASATSVASAAPTSAARKAAAQKTAALPAAPLQAPVRRQDEADTSASMTGSYSTATSATGTTGVPGLPTGAPVSTPSIPT